MPPEESFSPGLSISSTGIQGPGLRHKCSQRGCGQGGLSHGPPCQAPIGLPDVPVPRASGLPGRCVSHLRCSTARSDPIPLAQIALPQSSPPPPSPRPLEDPLHPLHPLPCIPGHPTQQPYFVTQGTLPAGQPRTGRGEHLALGGLDWTVSLCISLTPTQTLLSHFLGAPSSPRPRFPMQEKYQNPHSASQTLVQAHLLSPPSPLVGHRAQPGLGPWSLQELTVEECRLMVSRRRQAPHQPPEAVGTQEGRREPVQESWGCEGWGCSKQDSGLRGSRLPP